MNKIKSAFVSNDPKNIGYVYSNGRREIIEDLTNSHNEIISEKNFDEKLDVLSEIEVIFSTWGMPCFSENQLNAMPNLKAVFYAAGATDNFVRPLLARGITVCSAWRENAIPVAEFTVSQIILACKGYFQNVISYRRAVKIQDFSNLYVGQGIYNTKIILLGDGAIAHRVMEMLQNCYKLDVTMVASREQVRKISFDQAFKEGYVISNHLPNREDNQKVFNEELFRSMPYGATFINTGRGAQVDEEAIVKVLSERKDLVALLDVTEPEPVEINSPLLTCPNILITSHIAGSLNNEVVRMADSAIEEFKRYASGEKCQHTVSEDILITSVK
ncbi:NAD(P)-dependent oxidoreductase [Lentisphaerota bacterium WC36G]|nr:phosphoglycerate dehydrogenase [Lentisphaerae bacterium WC36]